MFWIGLGFGLLVGLLVGLFSCGLGKMAKNDEEAVIEYLESLPDEERVKHCGTCGGKLED